MTHSTPRYYLPRYMYVHTEFYTVLTEAILTAAPNWKQLKYPSTGKWINNTTYAFGALPEHLE